MEGEKGYMEGDSGTISSMDKEQAIENDLDACVAPVVGMEFESDVEAHRFFNTYAKQVGFETRIRQSQRTRTRGKCFVHFCCNREGFKTTNATMRAARADIRCGCPVAMKLRLNEFGKWKVVEVNLQHNHLVNPTEAQSMSQKRAERVKKRSRSSVKTNQLVQKTSQDDNKDAGGHEHLELGDKPSPNHASKVRKLELRKGDAEAMCKFFSHKKSRSPNFFYLLDFNEEFCVRNAFWAEARSQQAYQNYGDVVTIDTTYLTKNYNVKFVPFFGVNHHGKPVLLGCGLLEGETEESFVWLLEKWLAAMLDRAPNAIIIDQSEAIQTAVAEVFPNTHYRLRLSHIMRTFYEKFGRLVDYEALKFHFEKVVYDSLKADEFEHQWNEMIDKYNFESNRWLKTLYQLREKWVPLYLKHTFWAGMSSTFCDEGMNSFFDKYLNIRTSLKDFFEQYDFALENYEREFLTNFSEMNSEPTLSMRHNFEIQLAPIYTSSIFKRFQEEVISALCNCYNITAFHVDGEITTYVVKERIFDKNGMQLAPKEYEVYFNMDQVEVTCICSLFQTKGYLCRHALYTLNHNGVDEIPSRYIIARWRKDFKYKRSLDCGFTNLSISDPLHRFDMLYRIGTQLVEEGAVSKQRCSIALQFLQETLEEVRRANDHLSADGPNQHKRDGSHEEFMSEENSVVGSASCEHKKLQNAETPNISNASVVSGPLVAPTTPVLFNLCSTQVDNT